MLGKRSTRVNTIGPRSLIPLSTFYPAGKILLFDIKLTTFANDKFIYDEAAFP